MSVQPTKLYTLDQIMAAYWDCHRIDYRDDQTMFQAMREFQCYLDAMVDWRLALVQREMKQTIVRRLKNWAQAKYVGDGTIDCSPLPK